MRTMRTAIAALVAMASWPAAPAGAAVCSDPTTYLIVCCPKPCQVFDLGAIAARQGVVAQEVYLLGMMMHQTARLLQQVEGLTQAVMNVGKAGASGLSNPFHQVPVQYGPMDANLSPADRYSSMRAMYSPEAVTTGPTTYARATWVATHADVGNAHVGALAYAMHVRQYESGETPQATADVKRLAELVANAKDRREDVQARGYVLIQLMQETQFRIGLTSRLAEMRAKNMAVRMQMDQTPDFTRQ